MARFSLASVVLAAVLIAVAAQAPVPTAVVAAPPGSAAPVTYVPQYPSPTPAGTVVVYQPAPAGTPQYAPIAAAPAASYVIAEPGQFQPASASSQGYYKRKRREGGSGWFILGLFSLLFAGYVVVGCYYNRTTDGLSGIAAFPHIEFWRRIPSYVIDGCSFTRRWVEGSLSRGSPLHPNEVLVASGSYEPIGSGGLRVSTSKTSAAAAMEEEAALDDAEYLKSIEEGRGGFATAGSGNYDSLKNA